jgi:hypothetical protein
MQKDIAFLKVHNADSESLQFGRETYGRMPVMVKAFLQKTSIACSNHRQGKHWGDNSELYFARNGKHQ